MGSGPSKRRALLSRLGIPTGVPPFTYQDPPLCEGRRIVSGVGNFDDRLEDVTIGE